MKHNFLKNIDFNMFFNLLQTNEEVLDGFVRGVDVKSTNEELFPEE
jgi:hypothetical protein